MSSSLRTLPVLPSDEVNLGEIFRSIWGQKKLIMAIAAGVGLVAVSYAFLATPEYQVSSVLRPAAINELDALNRSEVYRLPPSEALTRVGASLESYDTRLGFFRANQNLFKEFERPGRTLEQSFEAFNRNSISLVLPDPKKSDVLSSFIKLDLNYPKGIDGVAILNGLVNYAIALERQQIAADLSVIVKNRLSELDGKFNAARASYLANKEAKIAALLEVDNLKRAELQDELKALRVQLKTERSDRVSQLNEAINIAKSLGIKKPTTPSALSEGAGGANVMRTEVNNQQIPLYFMGVDALEAERTALQLRKSDDFTERRIAQIAKELELLKSNRQVEMLNRRENEDIFLSDVQPLRAEIARLHSLSLDISRLKLVSIDRQALEPLKPIKPNRAFIIIFGLIFGVMFGVAIAVTRAFIVSRRVGLASVIHHTLPSHTQAGS